MKRMFGMCLNPKVLAGLGALAVGLFAFASPAAALRALPLLFALACPLSMLLMGAMMRPGAGVASSLNQPTDRQTQIASLRSRLESLENTEGGAM